MNILPMLIFFSFALAFSFVGFFIWASKNGQFDDLDTPAQRILFEDKKK